MRHSMDGDPIAILSDCHAVKLTQFNICFPHFVTKRKAIGFNVKNWIANRTFIDGNYVLTDFNFSFINHHDYKP